MQKNINQTVFDAVINEIAKNHYDGNFRQNYAQKIKKFRQTNFGEIFVNFIQILLFFFHC